MKCPNCSGTECRESKWRSHREKAEHPGSHPYRCLGCSNRFIAPAHRIPAGNGKLMAGAAVLIVAVLAGVAVGVGHVWDSREAAAEPAVAAPAPASTLAADALKAAHEGNPDAQYRVAKSMLYDTSRGKETAAEAVDWLTRAADNGHTGAMVQLGKLYRTGLGVLQNFDLAVEWMRRAAASGDAEGMMELGRLYRTGTGVKQDLIQAYVWFNRAAASLHTEALHERENVALRLTPAELKEAQVRSAADDAEILAENAAPAARSSSDVVQR